MDQGQQWAVTIAAQALADYGLPGRALDLERTGVILGAAIGGELQYLTVLRMSFPEFRAEARGGRGVPELPPDLRRTIVDALAGGRAQDACPRSPRTRCRASSRTSSPAASRTSSTSAGRTSPPMRRAPRASPPSTRRSNLLGEHHCDAVITGGVDRNMGVVVVREVLQDRRAERDRHAPVRRRRRWLRDGRGRRRVRAQAPRGRRARRRPDLRGDPRRGRLERRQGQGDHRAEPGRPEAGGASAPGRTPGSIRRPPR